MDVHSTVDAADSLWDRVSALIVDQVSDAVWKATFRDIRPVALDDTDLTLAVPSLVVRERVEQRFRGLIEAALTDAGRDGLRLQLIVDSSDDPDDDPLVGLPFTPTTTTAMRPATPAPSLSAEPADRGADTLGASMGTPDANPRYTFESFVIGPSNRFAHAAALKVAETPAKSYNPLFVYGDAGLGKTHLLQAIANYVAENYPTYRIRYISTETLLNEFVESIRKNAQTQFKRRYRDIDVLLVDDIQFMEGKEQLQEEFFHTFNTLYESQRQIVLSSDRPPDAIATLEDRLRSRFKMGLITDIQPPGFETRLAILQKKAEQSLTPIPAEVLEFIAENITYNIRVLEGALTRVSAYAALNQEELTADLARQVLADSIASSGPRQITVDLILERTSEFFGVSLGDLKGTSRTRDLVHARQIAMYVCRELTELSYPQIAKAFGGRDHTTVIYANNKITQQIAERRRTYDDVTALIQKIRHGD